MKHAKSKNQVLNYQILNKCFFAAIIFLCAFIVPANAIEKKINFEVQALLNALGYEVGVVDGKLG